MEDMQQEIIDLESKSAGTDLDSVVADIRSIYLLHCRTEEALKDILDAIEGPSDEIRLGAEALRKWKGCNVHIDYDADLEEIAEVVLNTVTIPEPTPHNDQATDRLAHALPRIKELLNWFADRSGRTVTNSDSQTATGSQL